MASPSPGKRRSLVPKMPKMFRRSSGSKGSAKSFTSIDSLSNAAGATEEDSRLSKASASPSEKRTSLVSKVVAGQRQVMSKVVGGPKQKSQAWEANAMCQDPAHPVPDPPDLNEAKDREDFWGEDPKVIQRIKSTTWANATDAYKTDAFPFGQVRPDARTRPLAGSHAEFPYECLVLKGGGAKGSIYPGAIRALEVKGIMPHIKRFAGASAGALVAALLAAGLSADQLFLELATTDLQPLVLDATGTLAKMQGTFNKYGMNPGNGLYQHIGLLFYKYLGCADITFKQLFDVFGVELAVAVTNVSRAAVELLHVKTAPDYPIRKAVRASMSLPMALQPCRDKNIHSVVSDDVLRLHKEMEATGAIDIAAPSNGGSTDAKEAPVELYVDGGVLNNYPIDSFDGWWLSMEKDDAFFRKVIGDGGHKNYVERFGAMDKKKGVREVNPKTIGFRLVAAYEPDGMHSRLGNDRIELKVRKTDAAKLPDTPLASKYAPHRYELTEKSEANFKLDRDLRAFMNWITTLREAEKERAEHAPAGEAPPHSLASLAEALNEPPPQVLDVLDLVGSKTPGSDIAEILRHHHHHHHYMRSATAEEHAALQRTPTRAELDELLQTEGWASRQVKRLYDKQTVDDAVKLGAIQAIIKGAKSPVVPTLLQACSHMEELLEVRGEEIVKSLTGMEPKEIGAIAPFLFRMIDAIQMTNDERVHTKENYSRTCMLNTEYVGTMDFKLDEADHYFLWRKGFLSCLEWLDSKSKKAKDKKKGVANALAKELKKEASVIKAAQLAAASKPADPLEELQHQVEKVIANTKLSEAEKLDIIQRRVKAAHTSTSAA